MSSTVYNLNYDWDYEIKRLKTQHNFMRAMTLVDFPPPVYDYIKDMEAPKIADVATGTGIWATELAAKLPSAAIIEGFDFDMTKFPEAESLPPNVTLKFGDIFKPFPQEVLGKYDVVHVRLLVFALKKDQWLSVV
ncbi:N-methyltransferase tcpN [Paramyrothecium foliicola]|nr:N-methyltransferase tcpN [Paramyrothecium foliicola]